MQNHLSGRAPQLEQQQMEGPDPNLEAVAVQIEKTRLALTKMVTSLNGLDQSQFLVKWQVAQRLQKTTRTVELWTRRGILPCLKIGRSVLYFWPDVEKQLRDNFTLNRPSSYAADKKGTTTKKG